MWGIARSRLAACASVALAAVAPAQGQSFYERNAAATKCHREAQRSAGLPPRDEPRPGDDIVQLERRRRDWHDRYYSQLDRCLYEADRRLREKRQ